MKPQPIRIAQVIGKANLSGVDTVVMEYYRHIDRKRIQFDFIIDGYEKTPIDEEIRELGGRIYKVEPYARNVVKSVQQWTAFFRENNYPIVHSHLNTLSVLPLYAAWRAKVPIRIAHNHSTSSPGEGSRTILKYLLRPGARLFATHYCSCSSLAGKWLFGERFYNSGQVRLIKNAINIDKFSYNFQVRDQVRREFQLEGKLVVGHVGRFVYQKNHAFLLDIFLETHRRNDSAVLMLVGAGELEQAIKNKTESLGLKKSVLFLGTRTDVASLMQAMDVFIFPSHYEGLGMVAIEAQVAGLPAIVSEAVPREANITNLLEYCQLSQPASVWAEKALVQGGRKDYIRERQDDQLRRAGYDIETAARELNEWYEEMLRCLKK